MAAKYDDDEVYLNDLYKGQEVTVPEFQLFIGHVSYGLYSLACEIVGDEDVIKLRRQVTDLNNEYNRMMAGKKNTDWYVNLSGSMSEGFRFSSSDYDFMYVYRHVKVIYSITNHHQFEDNTTVLLMESDKTRPGFVLLRLIGNAYNSDVQRSLVSYLSETYVSSQIWRDESPYKSESQNIHGPCISGKIHWIEYDRAFCIHSSQWPRSANGCIVRLLKRKWPPLEVVQNIIASGVLFVPICVKQSQYEFVEWRLSFSASERKLIHSMNHTQFMCYGLLKIFLKEAINNVEEINSILCSYYLKTAVFWEILDSTVQWVPNKLVRCFWQCLCKIIQWVDNEYLPNFFIPENNMLIGKFQPGQKKKLMDHLAMLQSEGYACLLRCPSLRRNMANIIQRPLIVYTQQEYHQVNHKCRRDVELITGIFWGVIPAQYTIRDHLFVLQVLNHLLSTKNVTDNDQILGILWRRHLSRYVTLYYATMFNSCSISNKQLYRIETKLLKIINRCGIDCVSHYIDIALQLYRFGRYELVIKIIQHIKVRLQNPYLIYVHTISNMNEDKYRAAGGGDLPYSTMARHNIALQIELFSKTCIPELRLEHETSKSAEGHLLFSPLVISSFLECLSYYHLGHHQLVQNVVSDLYTLVHYDDGYHIFSIQKALSWQILGICQEMTRDYQGAYQSYSNALHDQYSFIQPASQRRLSKLCGT